MANYSVIDTDTHLTEPHDLWTANAPAAYRDRVPSVKVVDGLQMWTVDGAVLGRASASSVVHRDGHRNRGMEFTSWNFDDAAIAAWDVDARLAMMDENGIWAHVIYPNAAGFGGQRFADLDDLVLKNMSASLYNDAMVEIQRNGRGRLFPMALMPWWDIEASVAEAERCAAMGLRGINMTSDPQQGGAPDLACGDWDPFWEVCEGLGLPVNFHIGASQNTFSWFGDSPWPSLDPDRKLGIGSSMMYLSNARVISNLIFCGVLERHPQLQFVSVESGIGWIPFLLEAIEHQFHETSENGFPDLSLTPLEYFQRNMYACYWFEKANIAHTISVLGADRILFETDFPHPTCLFPDSMATAAPGLATLSEDDRRKVLQDNAAALYGIELPG